MPRNIGFYEDRQEIARRGNLGNGSGKSTVYMHLKIKNTVNVHLRFVMGG